MMRVVEQAAGGSAGCAGRRLVSTSIDIRLLLRQAMSAQRKQAQANKAGGGVARPVDRLAEHAHDAAEEDQDDHQDEERGGDQRLRRAHSFVEFSHQALPPSAGWVSAAMTQRKLTSANGRSGHRSA